VLGDHGVRLASPHGALGAPRPGAPGGALVMPRKIWSGPQAAGSNRQCVYSFLPRNPRVWPRDPAWGHRAGAWAGFACCCCCFTYIGSPSGSIQRPKPVGYVQYGYYETTESS
jgi:hypothetical protein